MKYSDSVKTNRNTILKYSVPVKRKRIWIINIPIPIRFLITPIRLIPIKHHIPVVFLLTYSKLNAKLENHNVVALS